MLHYSKEVTNNLRASRIRDKGWCQWNWALLRDSILSNHIGMIGSSQGMVSNKIGLKSSVMDMGNWDISGMIAQGNRQADPMLMVQLVHSTMLLICHHFHLTLLIL